LKRYGKPDQAAFATGLILQSVTIPRGQVSLASAHNGIAEQT